LKNGYTKIPSSVNMAKKVMLNLCLTNLALYYIDMWGMAGIPPSLMEVSGQLRNMVTLPMGRQPLVPTVQEAGWASELVRMQWSREKSLAPATNLTLAIQPMAHHILALLDIIS
jgi:hypothetical protein